MYAQSDLFLRGSKNSATQERTQPAHDQKKDPHMHFYVSPFPTEPNPLIDLFTPVCEFYHRILASSLVLKTHRTVSLFFFVQGKHALPSIKRQNATRGRLRSTGLHPTKPSVRTQHKSMRFCTIP